VTVSDEKVRAKQLLLRATYECCSDAVKTVYSAIAEIKLKTNISKRNTVFHKMNMASSTFTYNDERRLDFFMHK